MPTYVFTAPDGKEIEVTGPEGSTVDQAFEIAQRQMNAPTAKETRGNFTLGFIRGAAKPLNNAAMAFESGLRNIGVPVDKIGKYVSEATGGLVAPTTAAAQEQQRAFFDKRAAQGVRPSGVGEFVGNVVGTLPTALIPGGPFVQGAASGALLTDETTLGGVLRDAAVGGAAGKAGDMLFKGVGRVLAPKTSPAVRTLAKEGVEMTPGDMVGGITKRIEDTLAGYPVTGNIIGAAKRRGLDSLNRAAINRALKPIGKELPKGVNAGHEAVGFAQEQLSRAYDDLLPKLTVRADRPFSESMTNLYNLAREMPEERFGQFESVIKRQIWDRFSKGGAMSGEAMKEAESELGRLIRTYGASSSGDERLLADALREAQSLLRQMVERSNPAKALELKSINRGFANLLRVERAASQAKGGVFSPAQLQTATRVMDSSGRKRASASGKALMQDLAAAGREVLPASIPDSGTAGRVLPWIMAGGGGLSGAGEAYDNPYLKTAGALTLLAGGAYSAPGQRALRALLMERPELLRQIGGIFAETPAVVPIGGATLAVGGQ